MDPTILIVDDEKHTREGLRLSLEDDFDVYVASNSAEAMEILRHDNVQLMLTDLRLGGESGMDLIQSALALPQPPICVMMTAYGSVDTAVEAMKQGAYDFVTKPLNLDEVEILIKRALKNRATEKENVELKRQVERKYTIDGILGQAENMKPVFEIIEQVAPTRATVLIDGESGTGKELVARAIHNLSGRPKAKLVTVHCAALSPNVLESELFGHEKGAFTGAQDKRIGRFELADGGTLFLDEIGEIDANIQVKLLRALGEQTIERVGGSKPIHVDVRVVTATNKDLAALVKEGKFREDLYWRLHVVRIHLPPLRERKPDIPVLADAFLRELAELNNKPYKPLSEEALQALLAYNWPGNVRELRAAIEHGIVMCNSARVGLKNLPPTVTGGSFISFNSTSSTTAPAEVPLIDLNLETMERRLIDEALVRSGDNRTEAAELLGLSRRTLQRKLKEMNRVKRIRRSE
ncbi:sigma-54-dependent Fis family transcriptional regulator [Phragmitibacter flavus]|uniref:Sigma-54-dependent Fis family transcriptional regulator n=1 Tax=Phragmitibacter flavus TaxID=2576071 RepID=A0A5R8KDR8_9BACT|nr:sigma-54 dependent transcriptional regulator [Phragmitibacter flavus]TLD69729.1 sigma-54-dependent Fis family transcriptional regulator [Phragmitibacter flavus]